MLLNDQWLIDEIRVKIKKFLEEKMKTQPLSSFSFIPWQNPFEQCNEETMDNNVKYILLGEG
jgi:hypothetical protein